jgi:hypothetical protein
VKIVPFNQIDPNVWNKFVDESPEAWLYHRAEWVELEVAEGYQNESFMVVSDDGQRLGIFCVYLSGQGPWWRLWERYFHTGHCRSGPAMAFGLNLKQRKNVTVFGLDYLKKRGEIYSANRLEVRLPSLAPAYLPPSRSEISPLYQYGFNTFPMYGISGIGRMQTVVTPTTIVELLSADEEGLFAALSTRGRNSIRKAYRSDVTCIQHDGVVGLETFYIPYKSSHLHSGATEKPPAFFQKMQKNLAEKGYMKIFIALFERKTVASVLLLCYKDAVTYYAGGVDYTAQQLRPQNLLLWETLKWAKQNGWKWYEMGPYFPYLPEDNKMAGLGLFKRQFGGREFSLFEGIFFYNWPMYLGGALVEETRLQIYYWLRRVRSFYKGAK